MFWLYRSSKQKRGKEEEVVDETMVEEENIFGTIHTVDGGDEKRRHTFLYKLYEDAP